MGFIEFFYTVFGIWVVLSIAAMYQLQGFLSSHPSISTFTDIEDLKKVARLQMYGALVVIVFGIITFALSIYFIFSGKLGLLIIILLNGVIFILGTITKSLEKKVKSLPVTNKELEEQYLHIIDVWMHKPFPDF